MMPQTKNERRCSARPAASAHQSNGRLEPRVAARPTVIHLQPNQTRDTGPCICASPERPNNGANVILDLGVPSVPAASRAPAKPTPALGRQGPRHAALLAQPQFWKTADPPTRTLQRPSRLAYPPGNRLEPISHLVSGWLAASAGPAVCPLFLSISVPRLGAAALHGTIACPATGRDMSSGTSLGASGCSAVGRPASNLSHLFPHRPSHRSHQTCRRPLPPNWAPRSAAHTCGVERC